jgi:hypothetical protein
MKEQEFSSEEAIREGIRDGVSVVGALAERLKPKEATKYLKRRVKSVLRRMVS